ncbi:spatacsin-like, partial [Liolophura sinensis]|uniref:spatacsin-like n=1 Tax=Liolophura sinensis TaxID=3198878 RepID=UPI0031595EC2
MEDSAMKCIVQKFKTSLPCSDAKCILPSLACNKLAFLSTCGELTVVDIARDNVAGRHVIEGVESFSWLADTGVDEDEVQCPAFCVVDKNLGISVYTLRSGTLETVYAYEAAFIKQLLENRDVVPTSLELLSYRGNIICLNCGNSTVVSLQLRRDEPVTALSVLSLNHIHTSPADPGSPVSCPYWTVKRDVLVAYDSNSQKLFVYSVTSGGLLAWLDLAQHIPKEALVWWELSEDLDYLCLISHSNQLFHLSLRSFVAAFPASLKYMSSALGDETFTELSTLRTAKAETFVTTTLGDPPWRSQMAELLTLNSVTSQTPWYLGCYDEGSKRTTPNGKTAITGFRKKHQPVTDTTVLTSELKIVKEIALDVTLTANIHQVVVSANSVDVKSGGLTEFHLGICNTTQGTVIIHGFSPGEILLLSDAPGHPHLLLTPNTLATVGQLAGQEQLVSSVMLYGGAGTADVLCHLNKWDRCTIPINTLETGLKHRQLDTVTFFLKSKENLFSSNRTKVSSPSSDGADGSATFSWVPSYSHEENFSQVEPALDLLVQCVRESVAEAQSRQFAEQLLSVTLHHLYGLQADALVVVRDCWGSPSPFPEESQEVEVLEGIAGKLMLKIGQLRRFQR